ncbi:hypothetical protein V6B08_06700 [Ferrovibrio sp. MS7]|jgi:hypothetical protein|uniref:hypothetical protein n=1 Tax=Ferrovibrio TaxID=1231242 RepID=UPI001B551F47|nr:hypothetical protein [Ferrovibrio sp.]
MKKSATKKPDKNPLPPTLVAAMFNEAGVLLRPGRAKAIAGALTPALTRFRPLAAKLPMEAEPGLFPAKKPGGK